MTSHTWRIFLALSLLPTSGYAQRPTSAIAQRPSVILATGAHVQSVGGSAAGGVVVEAGVSLYVAPMIVVRPEVAWVSAPSQGEGPVTGTARVRAVGGGAGGHPELFFLGGSLVVTRTSVDSARWYALLGGSVVHGRGNSNWSATRPAFAPHFGIGFRPFVDRPRFVLEARGRYAPKWFNDPMRYLGIVAGWTI